jgi:antitoxin (DNA-binding transcriptional repressor) of toxin-antitoxin stability system
MFRGLIQWVEMTCSARLEAVVVKKVRVTETKAHLSALMARAGYAGERYPIERRGKPLAALVGSRTSNDWRRRAGPPLEAPGGAGGAWGEFVGDEEIDTMVGEIYAARDRDTGRPVDLEA